MSAPNPGFGFREGYAHVSDAVAAGSAVASADGSVEVSVLPGPITDLSIEGSPSLASAIKNGTMSSAQFSALASIPTIRSGRETLVATGNGFTINGLTGDTDGDYELYGMIFLAAGVANPLVCNPNGDTTFGIYEGEFIQGQGGGAFAAARTSLFINDTAGPVADGLPLHFRARLKSKSGEGPRFWECTSYCTEAGGHSIVQSAGQWLNTTDEITSVSILGANLSMLAGSYVAWRSLGFNS
jgi:hypothetical protein